MALSKSLKGMGTSIPTNLFASTRAADSMVVGLVAMVFARVSAEWFLAKLLWLDYSAEMLVVLTVIAWGNT